MEWALATTALALIAFGVVSRRIDGTPVTPAIATVGLSELVHGVAAAPLARRYATWFASHPPDQMPTMESVPVGTQRWRRPVVSGDVVPEQLVRS